MRRIAAAAASVGALIMLAQPALSQETAPGDVKIEDMAINASLTSTPGNAEEGAKTFVNRSLGNCLACHQVQSLSNEQFHGNVAPPLDGVADRWTVDELRAIVVDAKKVFSDESMMPGFYTLDVGINVRKDLVGATVLTAQQVEDVVAYLATLKE